MPSEVPDLMLELPFCSDCFGHQADLTHLVEICDKHSGEELDCDALVLLMLKVTEKCRMVQRESEAYVSKQVGFSIKQVLQLRESFAAMTVTGVLGVEELRKWFQEINPSIDPTTRELQ